MITSYVNSPISFMVLSIEDACKVHEGCVSKLHKEVRIRHVCIKCMKYVEYMKHVECM